jgi:tetratricopeptide (TPR) repeat protein
MEKVKCPQCGRERKKKFAKFCEACGVSFCKEIQVSPPKSEGNSQQQTSSNSKTASERIHNVRIEVTRDEISSKAQKFISMAAYDLAIKQLEKELAENRGVHRLHALSMCYLCKCGGIKTSFDFSNWFTVVMGIFSAIEKAIKIEQAEAYISEAIDMDPHNNLLYKTLALCKYTSGNYEQSLKMGRAISDESRDLVEKAGCQIFIANCFRQLGNSRAYENRMQYAAYLMGDNDQLSKKIREMMEAKSMLLGGAAIAGYMLAGPIGGAVAAGVSAIVQGASDQRQFEDDDPEIHGFIEMRDKEIKWAKEDEEARREAERQANFWGCVSKFAFIGFLGFVLLMLLSGGR